MKKKIVGIVIFMLVATMMASATNINEKENINTTTSVAEVPIYEVGDSWTYEHEESNYNYDNQGRIYFAVNLSFTSTVTVTDDAGDSYNFEEIAENVQGDLMWFSTKIKFTRFTKIKFEYQRRKTDLAESKYSMEVKGFVFWLKGEINFPIPAQMYWRQDNINTPPMIYLPFPLTAGTNGTISGYNTHANTICSLYWGRIPLWDGEVDFEEGSSNCTCEMASITIPAGTYDAYNVSIERPWGLSAYDYDRYYYVPELGNVAKQFIHKDWDSSGRTWFDSEIELVSTTYNP